MAKKFVRGITDIKNIEHQDLDTNNVNDLLSDGKHNFIHRKKQDGSEEYHNLTDNIKTIQSDDTDLLTVTNYNNTTNSATIRPKHDTQKEQVLESTDNTILISHGENGTDETTTVDVNPAKVLEHDNLLTDYGISKTPSGNTIKLGLEYTRVNEGFDLNTLVNGNVRAGSFLNAPQEDTWFFVSASSEYQHTLQRAVALLDTNNKVYVRVKRGDTWGEWRERAGDMSIIDNLLAEKQNTLTNNTSIGVNGTQLNQLYTNAQTYTHSNGTLKTYVKSVSNSTSIYTAEEEFHLLAKMNKTQTNAQFTLNDHDTAVFEYLMETYGVDNKLNLSWGDFTLNGSSLSLYSSGAHSDPHLFNFSDIVPANLQIQSVQKVDEVVTEKVEEIVDKTVETEKVDEVVTEKVEEIVDKTVETEKVDEVDEVVTEKVEEIVDKTVETEKVDEVDEVVTEKEQTE